jgi:hypothetical protein
MLRMLLVATFLAAVPATCAGDQFDRPGQANFRGTITVLNRTEGPVTLASETRTLEVPPCQQATLEDGLVNFWTLTSPGGGSFRAGGGHAAPNTFLMVTAAVQQVDELPGVLPPCKGLLEPAN